MATPINTRILLRNDTLANWTGSSLVLGKGEVAIATLDGGKLAEVRVGTGSSTWATSLKLNVNADQISGLIETIQGTAKKYQVVANGEGGNSWKLQEAALSGGDWSDVSDSTWSVDFTAINNAINNLTSNVSYLSGQIDATNATLNTVSSDYLTSTDKTELSNALTALDSAKLAKTDFATISNDTGLSAASASNPVVTKNDIADLAGAMHFRGAVSDPSDITDPKAGDVVIVTSTSKEYVYNGTAWIELGDEALYATKAEVATVSAGLTADIAKLTANDEYLSGQITSITSNYATKQELNAVSVALSTDYVGKIKTVDDKVDGILSDYLKAEDKTELETLVGTTSAETLVSANAYADSKFAGLSDYYTKDEVDAISSALSTDYVGKIKAVDDKLADYALSADVIALVNETSAATITTVVGQTTDLSSADTINGTKAYAKDYADGAVAALSIDDYIKHGEVTETDLCGFFILDCGASNLRPGEPTPPFNA